MGVLRQGHEDVQKQVPWNFPVDMKIKEEENTNTTMVKVEEHQGIDVTRYKVEEREIDATKDEHVHKFIVKIENE